MDKVKMFIDNDTINGLMAYDIVIERSDSGTMVARLAAPLMISVDQGDSTLIEFPKGFNAVAFNGDTVPTMKIRGDYGINNEIDQYIIAKRNVVIENIETGETLETDNLFWDQKKKKYTPAPCHHQGTGQDHLRRQPHRRRGLQQKGHSRHKGDHRH